MQATYRRHWRIAAIIGAMSGVIALAGESRTPPGADRPASWPTNPNIVLIVLDDVGVDLLRIYEGGEDAACTPGIDRLAASGLLFTRAWTNPVCSPTRAQILTGLHGFRTGIGVVANHSDVGGGLHLPALTLPRALPTYATSAVGKWHLTRPGEAPTHPLDAGYDWYAGAMHNLGREIKNGGYTNWVKYVNGVPHVERNYATVDTADDAVTRAAAMTPPWFLYVAFNAIHTPLHDPPQSLCAQIECKRFGCPTPADAREQSRQMLETLDVVLEDMIERLRRIDPNVVVFLVGDNGTSPASDPPKPNRAKGTMYEGGVHVPLIVAGGGVRRGVCDALVGTVDLLATISDLAGTPHTTADSVSFAPLLFDERAPAARRTLYAERFVPNFDPRRPVSLRTHARAIRNRRYKLNYRTGRYGSTFELYDLKLDPGETENLYPPLGGRPEKAFQKLLDELNRMGVVCEGDANDDGQVSLADLSIVITNLGVTNATRADGDADGDGEVDATDLAIVLARLDLPC